MSISNEWFVAVFKCNSSDVKEVLVGFYRFVDELKGVRSLHFLIRDRVDEEVAFSFRVMVDPKFKETIKSKSVCKLATLLPPDKFVIDPTTTSDFGKYVAWSPEKRIRDFGQKKFNQFIDVLKNMSALFIDLLENDYFSSSERVELAPLLTQMLGCTEYGALYASEFEVGYYDRLNDKYCANLKENFKQLDESK